MHYPPTGSGAIAEERCRPSYTKLVCGVKRPLGGVAGPALTRGERHDGAGTEDGGYPCPEKCRGRGYGVGAADGERWGEWVRMHAADGNVGDAENWVGVEQAKATFPRI